MVMEISEELQLTERQQHYLDWLLVAPTERIPTSKKAYADEILQMNVKVLRRWEKKEIFLNEWKRRAEELQGSPERTQVLLDSLYAKGVAGDTKAAQLYMQATNRIAPPSLNLTSTRRTADLSDSELDELIAQIAVHEKSKREQRGLKAVV